MPEPTAVGADGEPAWAGGPFAPTSLRVHPLTHVELDEDGRPVLVCHVEFADRWGDVVKATGMLRVEVVRVGEDVESAGVAWEIDLSDLETNVQRFDPVTRTYRLHLGGLGEWARALVEDGGEPVAARVMATLVGTGPRERQRRLEGRLTIRG